MRRSIIPTLLAGLCFAGPTFAYEFPLQFSAPSNSRSLNVAGYAFVGKKVSGDCSYYTITSGSGRDPRSYITHFYQGCTWDLHGNMLSIVSGEPAAPTPISSVAGVTIYARDAKGDTTGVDSTRGAAFGFVNTPSAIYTWLTASGGYVFLNNQQPIDISLSLQNVGDLPLVVKRFTPTTSYAKATVKSNTCTAAPVAPGASCTVVVTYDPSGIPPSDDPYTAYDRLTVSAVSNSGLAPTFSESIEVPIAPGG